MHCIFLPCRMRAQLICPTGLCRFYATAESLNSTLLYSTLGYMCFAFRSLSTIEWLIVTQASIIVPSIHSVSSCRHVSTWIAVPSHEFIQSFTQILNKFFFERNCTIASTEHSHNELSNGNGTAKDAKLMKRPLHRKFISIEYFLFRFRWPFVFEFHFLFSSPFTINANAFRRAGSGQLINENGWSSLTNAPRCTIKWWKVNSLLSHLPIAIDR